MNQRQLIQRYMNQPSVLPNEIMNYVTSSLKDFSLQLYSIVDLDDNLRLSADWLILGKDHLVIVYEKEGKYDRSFKVIERREIKSIETTVLSSCNRFTVWGKEKSSPLVILRYTHRQKRTMENIKFLIEQELAGSSVKTSNADNLYAESVTKPIKDTQSSVSANKMAVVWRLLSYLRPYRLKLLYGMTGAVLMTIMSLTPAYLTGRLLDKIIKPYQLGKIDLNAAAQAGWVIIIAITLVYIFSELFTWIRLKTMSKIGEYVAHDLRKEVYAHLQKLSLNYFSSRQTGSLISRVSSDTDRLWDFIAFGVVDVSISVIMLIGLGTTLIILDWKLGLIMTVPIPLFLFLIAHHGQMMQSLFLKAWHKWSRLTDVLSDTIPGVKVVKAFSQEKYESSRFNKRNADTLEAFNGIHDIWTSFWPLFMILVKSFMLVVWIWGFMRLLGIGNHGLITLSAGTFISFVLYMTQFIQPIEVIDQLARMLNRATSSAYRIFEVLDTEPQIITKPKAVRLNPIKGAVAFKNVSFSYDGVRYVIKNMDFNVRPGEMIGLVGPSGGGKSTITNLISRFYDVTNGQVLIDGVDVRNLDGHSFRKQIGIVLQEPYLFHGTILENIRYGMPEASSGKIVEAAKAANAHDFIGRLPQGYDTLVGERGHTLSGGERQRISIARAVLHDPRILILDEATSSVDSESERKIQEALNYLTKGRTVFAIAHRLSTLNKADRLLVIEDGAIVERGSHQELVAKENGCYFNLFNLQQDINNIFAV